MIDYTAFAFATTVITAITQHLKMFHILVRFLPIINIALGLLAGFLFIAPKHPLFAVLLGFTSGLCADGMSLGMSQISKWQKSKKDRCE
jgi:hypothetical protein